MFYCALKKELTFTLSRLETNNAYFSQEKFFLVFKVQPAFSKLSKAAPLDERDRISITSTPLLHYRTAYLRTFKIIQNDGKIEKLCDKKKKGRMIIVHIM